MAHPLAARIGQTTDPTPTNLAYVNLPDFLIMQGTLGVPKKKLNYIALAQMALILGGGILGGSTQTTTEKVTRVLSELKNALENRDSTNRITTPTNASSPKSILDNLLLPRLAPKTNAVPATNAPSQKGNR